MERRLQGSFGGKDFTHDLPSYIYLNSLQFSSFTRFSKYSFDIYLYSSYKALSHILKFYPCLIQGSLFSVDSKYLIYFLEVKKKLFLSYILRPISFGEFSDYSNIPFGISSSYPLGYGYLKVKLLVPLFYLYSKFRYLGFFHFSKFRPIGNSKFLFLSDYSIIREFSSLSYKLLIWYRFSYNFSKLKLLVEYLRQSCILTLCRKHNKSKRWANRVYSFNLFLYRNLFTFDSFFPSSLDMVLLKRDFFLENYTFFLSEIFFLEP